uniref:Uncharacterized protein n=1 Tax=Arundo donax TaxID=35708 RepID=A0A0A9B354_ARUDO
MAGNRGHHIFSGPYMSFPSPIVSLMGCLFSSYIEA